jgi:two-component system, cell cycle response regulator
MSSLLSSTQGFQEPRQRPDNITVRQAPRILLIDPSDAGRKLLADRLQLQGFTIIECRDGAEGAVRALEEPPAVIVADLSMPSISGVQLCRLLRSEGGTAHIPVVLRGTETPRNHFWAEQAGAFAYVVKGRMGELVRALRRAMDRQTAVTDDFFVVTSTEGLDVRERIAMHLDAALFDSVIAAEVRRLSNCESFDRLTDLLSQLFSRVTSYRWLALSRTTPARLGIHASSACRNSLGEARAALGVSDQVAVCIVEDDDAAPDPAGPSPMLEPVPFGDDRIGTIAMAPRAPVHPNDSVLLKTIARELGGPLRMATLIEESRWLATTDVLTGILNRRAFMDWATRELLQALRYEHEFSVILLDVDRFKRINDLCGHSSGDLVLASVARIISEAVRSCDVVARWGGEEFVLALPCTALEGAREVAERARQRIEMAAFFDVNSVRVPVTASMGVAQLLPNESIEQLVDRADRAMYAAKHAGRNRVVCTPVDGLVPMPIPTDEAASSTASPEPSVPPAATPAAPLPGPVANPARAEGTAASATKSAGMPPAPPPGPSAGTPLQGTSRKKVTHAG